MNGKRIQPEPARLGPAELLDQLDTEDFKRAGSPSPRHDGRSATRVHGGPPVNQTVLAHLAACDGEVAQFIDRARQADPPSEDDGPLPGRAGAYDRARYQAEQLGGDAQQYLEAMEWRHRITSALLLGEDDVIGTERCPACRTFGLVWVAESRTASCVNRYCAVDGAPRAWTIAQLAVERMARRSRRAAS
ncbi:hypothetical protein [Streptomyces ipomoeae]|uniref:hypothetical protein n=1 Tax=Streptomyces ipomoeae TaxID=103232 RepID=UPI0011462D70|nr:hypothetical protein [Streptomyces ipomoeae]TQE33128.1 hypothetical protein Sipo7851_21780 [Streptomyces ipomoeae]